MVKSSTEPSDHIPTDENPKIQNCGLALKTHIPNENGG